MGGRRRNHAPGEHEHYLHHTVGSFLDAIVIGLCGFVLIVVVLFDSFDILVYFDVFDFMVGFLDFLVAFDLFDDFDLVVGLLPQLVVYADSELAGDCSGLYHRVLQVARRGRHSLTVNWCRRFGGHWLMGCCSPVLHRARRPLQLIQLIISLLLHYAMWLLGK